MRLFGLDANRVGNGMAAGIRMVTGTGAATGIGTATESREWKLFQVTIAGVRLPSNARHLVSTDAGNGALWDPSLGPSLR
jgi:hypothetical protein